MTAVQQAKRNDQRTRRKVYSVSKRGRTSKTKGWLRRRHEMNQRREREVLEEPLPSERIIIGPLCEHAMKMETQHLIEDYGGHQCSILDIVTAIMLSQRVSSLYAAQAMDEQKPFSSKGYKEVNKRYELSKRLGSLRTLSSSASTRTNKWEDVKDILKEHLSFEDAQEIVLPEAEAPLDVILAKNVRRMRLITLESLVMSDRSPTWALWRGITEAVIPSFKAALKSDKEQESELEETRASYDELIKSTIVSDVAERLDREEREREARESMAKLMRPLDDDEMAIVKQAIFGMGPGTEILAESETEQVQRQSIRRLAPGQWLNDEVISFFLYTLTKRDQEMCKQEPSRKRSHFFKSFFITKLFDEGNNDPAKDGVYNYKNVKRWSKKVPGKDIFNLNCIVCPVNQGNVHWTCAVIFMQEKRIQFYDSMGGDGMYYLKGLLRYVQDEHQAKRGSPLPDVDSWKLVPCTSDTPRQLNCFDCGVFTCMFADFLSKGCPLVFDQSMITQCRERIALAIMNGTAIV